MVLSGGPTLGRPGAGSEHWRGAPRGRLVSPAATVAAVLLGWLLAVIFVRLHPARLQLARGSEAAFGILEEFSLSAGDSDARIGSETLLLGAGGGATEGVVGAPPPTSEGQAWRTKLPQARPQRPGDQKPRVFFDISIGGAPAGRVVFELFMKQSPLAAENFRALCTGEKGRVPDEAGREGAGQPLNFKGREFYRVIDRFICQSGAPTESIYGGQFKDDPGGLLLRHDRKGLLSMANMGHNTNTAHFSILMAPAPHLDGHYVIFGEVVSGFEVVEEMNKLAKPIGSVDERPKSPIVIADCGQL